MMLQLQGRVGDGLAVVRCVCGGLLVEDLGGGFDGHALLLSRWPAAEVSLDVTSTFRRPIILYSPISYN
jgi:hypothetical protein